MNGHDVTVWVDVSSLATCVVVESTGAPTEDVRWLRPVGEGKYINLAELDAMLKVVNMALL